MAKSANYFAHFTLKHPVVKKVFLIDGEMVEKPMIVVKDASDFIMHVFDLRNQSSYFGDISRQITKVCVCRYETQYILRTGKGNSM